MTKVYIVEEYRYDYHENVAVFTSRKKAEAFCDKKYGKRVAPCRWEEPSQTDYYSYSVTIEEYRVQE